MNVQVSFLIAFWNTYTGLTEGLKIQGDTQCDDGHNLLPSPVDVGLTDLPKTQGSFAPLAPGLN